jgi:hypothetical protein
MEYKLTYEDGSDAYLSHHGTKGMKWGVWNAETMAKYGVGAGVGLARKAAGAGGSGGVTIEEEDSNGVVSDAAKKIMDRINEEKAKKEQEKLEEERQSREEYDAQVRDLAEQVINGDWDNGDARYERLTESGYSYEDVQTKVNDIIYGTNDYESGINSSMREDPDNRSRRKQ